MDIHCNSPLYAWLESCSSTTCSPTATSAIAWVKLYSSIPANGGNLTIYMVFLSTLTDFDGIYWGEYPGLSQTYGQYDNGALVFKTYFNGNTPISDFSVFDGGTLANITGISGPGGATINALQLTGYRLQTPCFSFVTPMNNSGLVVESSFSLQASSLCTDTGMAGLVDNSTISNINNAIGANMGAGGSYFSQDYEIDGAFSGANYYGTSNSDWNYATLTYGGPNATSWTAFIAPQLYSTTKGYSGTVKNNPLLSASNLFLGQLSSSNAGCSLNVYYNFMRARALPPNDVMPSSTFGCLTPSYDNVTSIKFLRSLANVTQICSQGNYAMFLLNDSSVYSSGYNQMGQLGLGDFTNRNIPTMIPTLNGITSSITCGRDFVFANLSTSSTMYSWGQNVFGEIGNNETTWVVFSPKWLNTLSSVADISTISSETYYLLSNGTLFGDGQNSYGQLAQLDTNPVYSPTLINLPDRIIQSPMGYHHALYLLNNGALYGAGDNEYGQLGIGDTISPVTSTIQIKASGVSLVGAGHYHSFFVNSSGLYGMGLNSNYQLCLGNTNDQSSPSN